MCPWRIKVLAKQSTKDHPKTHAFLYVALDDECKLRHRNVGHSTLIPVHPLPLCWLSLLRKTLELFLFLLNPTLLNDPSVMNV